MEKGRKREAGFCCMGCLSGAIAVVSPPKPSSRSVGGGSLGRLVDVEDDFGNRDVAIDRMVVKKQPRHVGNPDSVGSVRNAKGRQRAGLFGRRPELFARKSVAPFR